MNPQTERYSVLLQTHDAVDIFQAAMEAVAYRFAEILKQLNSVVKVKEIVASGGAPLT